MAREVKNILKEKLKINYLTCLLSCISFNQICSRNDGLLRCIVIKIKYIMYKEI